MTTPILVTLYDDAPRTYTISNLPVPVTQQRVDAVNRSYQHIASGLDVFYLSPDGDLRFVPGDELELIEHIDVVLEALKRIFRGCGTIIFPDGEFQVEYIGPSSYVRVYSTAGLAAAA